MTLDQIKTFIETTRTGSMGRAAKKLYLSQPAVSQQIKKLEKELSCELFVRDSKRIKLTPEGKVFMRYAEYIYDEEVNCIANITRIREGLVGSLDFVTTAVAGEYILPPILNEFKSKYIFIDVNISVVDQSSVLESINAGKDKFGVIGIQPKYRHGHRVNGFDEARGIEAIRIGHDKNVFVAYTGHPLTRRKNITISDIAGEPIILKEIPRYRELEQIGIDLSNYNPRIITSTVGGVISMVEAKLGIGYVSEIAVRNSEAMGLVKALDIKDFFAVRDLYCIFKSDGERSPLSKDFIHFLREKYSGSAAETN